jgi:hypothetical protein
MMENADPKKAKPGVWRLVKRTLAAPFVLVAAIIILLEDWLWDDLARLAAALGRLPVLRSIEGLIASLPPYLALLFFGAPAVLLIPLKLAALFFLSHGHAELGLVVIVLAKFAGTALVARIFTLTRPQLLRIAWFAWSYERLTAYKTRIYSLIKSTALYQLVHEQHLRLRGAVKSWFGNRPGFLYKRWLATRRIARRRKQAWGK